MQIQNEERSERAKQALLRYAELTGQDPDAELEDMVTDLLADMLHMAQEQELNFEDCLRWAYEHYDEEASTDAFL